MKKVIFLVDEVLPTITTVAGVVSQKSTLQILEMLRLKCENKIVYICGSDGETFLTSNIKATSNENFDLCVNTKDFLQSLRGLTGKQIELEINDEKKLINGKYDNGHFVLPYVPSEDYPTPPVTDTTNVITVRESDLLRGVSLSEFSIANDDLRPIMNGINFNFGDKMVLASSDGAKLVRYTDFGYNENKGNFSFVLGKKPSHLLTTLLQQNQSDVIIKFNKTNAEFISNENEFVLQVRLIDGNYPNYNSVIPTTYTKYVEIDKTKLLDTLKRVLPFGSESTNVVILNFSNKKLLVKTEDLDFSKKAEESVECTIYDESDFKVGFKGSALQQTLQNVPSNCIKLLYDTNSKPILFVPNTASEDFEYLSLLMPLKID